MKIGYARVSTLDQNLDLQRSALTKAGCERIFEEKASGGTADRPQLAETLRTMRDGDTLVIWKLDRLARSLQQLIETAWMLEAQHMHLHSLTEAIDTATPGGRLTFHIFAALAEFERSLISERTSAGIAAARARGRIGGRPKRLSADDLLVARMLIQNGAATMEDIAKRLGCSRTTLYRALKVSLSIPFNQYQPT